MNVRVPSYVLVLAGILAGCLCASSSPGDEGFDRYAIILSKQPFGIPEAPPPPPPPPPPPSSPALASELRVCALTDFEGRGIRASVVENKTNKSYTLRIGETVQDIDLTLISADLENEEVTVRRGSEQAVMKLAAGPAKKPAARPSSVPTMARSVVSSKKYEDRREELAAARRERTERPPPKYTGEALRQHLREYNVEAIKQGLPALPVELTPEQDDQLVAEGFLPPSGNSFTSANDPLLLEAVEKELLEQAR